MNFQHIRCVAFDAVGTLIFPDPPVAEVYANAAKRQGVKLSQEEARQRFRQAFREEYQTHLPTHEAEEREKWRRIVRHVIGLDSEDCFEELFTHFGQPDSWQCFPDVPETLQVLAERGFELILASNFDRRLNAICAGHPPLADISRRVISSEVGWFKPQPEFYKALLKTAELEPHEVLMVGDDWVNDIQGATQSGLPAVFLDRSQRELLSKKDSTPIISRLTALLDVLP